MKSSLSSYWRATPSAEEVKANERKALAEVRTSVDAALTAAGRARPDDYLLAAVLADEAKRDELLQRYLRSHAGDAKKAAAGVETMLKWRLEVKIDEVSDPWLFVGSPGLSLPIWFSPLRGKEDAEHFGLSYFKVDCIPSKFDYKMLERASGVIFDWCLYSSHGMKASSLVSITDFAGFSVSQTDYRAMKTSVISYMQYYPGVFKKIFLVNYPVGIYALWKIVSPLLDQETIDRIVFVKSHVSLRRELAATLPSELVPDFLGGAGQTAEMGSNEMELANGMKLSVSDLSDRLK